LLQKQLLKQCPGKVFPFIERDYQETIIYDFKNLNKKTDKYFKI
jgi:hypothetical protein